MAESGGGMNDPCAWCDAPAIDRVLIQPGQYKAVAILHPRTGEPVVAQQASRFAIWAYVCTEHRTIRDREGGTPIPDKRRRKAADVDQLDIFGGSTATHKPGNAITGLS